MIFDSPYYSILLPKKKWFVMAFSAVAGALAATNFYFNIMDLFIIIALGLVWGILVQGCIRVVNDFYDKEIDRTNIALQKDPFSSTREIVKGRISKRNAIIYAILLHMVAFALNYLLSYFNFLMTVLVLFLSFLYSNNVVKLKKYFPINIIAVGFGYMILPLLGGWSVFTPVYQFQILPLLPFFLFMMWGPTIKDFSDIETDRKHGISTLPIIVGPKKAAKIYMIVYVSSWIYLAIGSFLSILPYHFRFISLIGILAFIATYSFYTSPIPERTEKFMGIVMLLYIITLILTVMTINWG